MEIWKYRNGCSIPYIVFVFREHVEQPYLGNDLWENGETDFWEMLYYKNQLNCNF